MPTMTQAEATQLFREPPHRFIDVGEGHAALRTVGAGPDVLFVHGWPLHGATFRKLLPHLSDHVTCHVIDFPGAGSSRFDESTTLSIDQHIETVRRVIDALGVADLAVVGHDSGGLIVRHAVVGDARVRSMGLIDTEQPGRMSWRFGAFVFGRHVPGFGRALGWVAGRPRLRRLKFVFGDAFVDRSLLDGEFDEFFLAPLHDDPVRLDAAMRIFSSFEPRFVHELGDIHARIDVPVQLVWGAQDPFFPVERARSMVDTFPTAALTVIEGASVFSEEERPAAVAAALLPVLTGSA